MQWNSGELIRHWKCLYERLDMTLGFSGWLRFPFLIFFFGDMAWRALYIQFKLDFLNTLATYLGTLYVPFFLCRGFFILAARRFYEGAQSQAH